MFIIIEGPDCSGKSTLAQSLADQLRENDPEATVQLYHRGPPTRHALLEYVEPVLGYRPGFRQHVICDRWHLGELVYPTVLNRSTTLTPGVLAWLELFLQSRGAYVVTIHAQTEYLTECGRFRGDSVDELALVEPANDLFRKVFAQTQLPTYALAAHEATQEDVHTILHEAQTADFRAGTALVHEPTTYVGAARPSLLLVGDRRGVAGEPADYGDWPAFAPFGGTSGDYLMSVLTREPLRVPTHGHVLSSLGIINANDVDDVYQVWYQLGKPSTVALGVEAARKLREVGVSYVRKVPHTQWWRRFRHRDGEVYLRRILGLDVLDVPAESREVVDA